MLDARAELRRVLSAVEGPMQYARKSDQTLLALRNFGGIVAQAAAHARRLPLSAQDRKLLDRIVASAVAFDDEGLQGRRRSLDAIAGELTRLDGPAPAHSPPGRPRVRPLSADATQAPVPVETDNLTRPLSSLKGVGPAIAQKLATRGLHTLGDVLLFLPRAYEDRRRQVRISEVCEGEHALLRTRIVAFHEKLVGRRSYELEVEDETGTLTARWFQFRPGAYRRFVPGAPAILSGKVRLGSRQRLEMIHPDIEMGALPDANDANFGRIVPVYTEIAGLSPRAYRKLAKEVVTACAPEVEDFLPTSFRAAHDLMHLPDALAAVHFPSEDADFVKLSRFASPPQRRLVFDELFFVQLGLALRKRGVQIEAGIPFRCDPRIVERALARLPFALTKAQRRALDEMMGDLAKPAPMNRLLQGDVGSGKTAVAFAAALVAVENGCQVALMAPTELLAEQHLRTFENLLGGGLFGSKTNDGPRVRVGILAAGRKPKELERTRNELSSGSVQIVVGTHALIQERVDFKRLGLVIIDEQHRFGVVQRAQLMAKGPKPHVLVMTATPIPRTLALTLYGDLDVSIIDELPPGRTPITTRLFPAHSRREAYGLVREQVAQGRQAYVVLPLVEESDKLDLRAATEEAERLRKEDLVGIEVGLVHGRMSTDDRRRAMDSFRCGETQVLVATTVIEVGVDVPNASVMVIEHAERFGLSQLHQLRGRVGRGAADSHCLLIADDEKSSEAAYDRLTVMVKTNDGFRLAEADLEIRGPGEFLGTRQSGLPDLVVADLLRDQWVLKEARKAAFDLVEQDPEMLRPEHRPIAAELSRRWAGKLSLVRVG